jgi:hypothetical protein
MAVYRVLRGSHAEGFYPKGHQLAGQPIVYNPGDVLESKNDLTKHNAKMDQRVLGKNYLGDKFALVDDDRVQPTDKVGSQEASVLQNGQSDDGLDKMNVAALRELAEGDDIDLGQAKNKQDIISAIRAVYAAA